MRTSRILAWAALALLVVVILAVFGQLDTKGLGPTPNGAFEACVRFASLPCGPASGGPPPSLQLVARELGEATLLQAGAVFERATPWHEQRPPV